MKSAALVLATCVAACLTATDGTYPPITLQLPILATMPTSIGELVTVQVLATADGSVGPPVSGLSITLATNTTGVVFTPATLTTDGGGSAITMVLVPYGADPIVTVSSGGGGYATAVLTTAPSITLSAIPQTPVSTATGELFAVNVSAHAGMLAIGGLTINLATNVSGLAFTPAAVVTDGMGSAVATIVVPYGTDATMTASSTGGGYKTAALAPAPSVVLSISTQSALETAAGELVTMRVHAGYRVRVINPWINTSAISGLAVSLATGTTGVAFSPATVTTDSTGDAIASVLVPYGVEPIAIATSPGGGYATAALTTPANVTLAIGSDIGAKDTAAGEQYTLHINATADMNIVAGLTLTLATNTTGVTFSPPTTVTDGGGSASATIIVPYGATPIVTVTSIGGGYTTQLLHAPVVSLNVDTTAAAPTPFGEQVPLTVHATVGAGGAALDASGVSLTFSSNVTGIAFSPSTLATDDHGHATAQVLVPYNGTTVTATVVGGGSAAFAGLSQLLPPLTIVVPSISATPATGGMVLSMVASVTAGSGAALTSIQNLVVSFTTNTSSVAFSPNASLTDAAGNAASSVFVPYSPTPIIATIATGGYATTKNLTDVVAAKIDPLALPCISDVGSTNVGSNATGESYELTATVTSAGSKIGGVLVSFVEVGATAAFTPGSVLTDGNGKASATVVITNAGSATKSGTVSAVWSVGTSVSVPFDVPGSLALCPP